MHINLTALFAASIVSALFASSSWAADPAIDFSTIAVVGGIDGYAITEAAATKIKGSPFVPTGLPQGFFPRSMTPNHLVPSPKGDIFFAIYFGQCGSGQRDAIVKLKLAKSGFTQQSVVALGSGGYSCSGGDYVHSYGATANFFFYTDSALDGPPNFHLYYTKGDEMTGAGDIYSSFGIEVYLLEQNESAVYECAAPYNTSIGAPYTQVNVYSLSSASLSFAFTSTDSEFIASKCGTVINDL